jgi:hypothetical protein
MAPTTALAPIFDVASPVGDSPSRKIVSVSIGSRVLSPARST